MLRVELIGVVVVLAAFCGISYGESCVSPVVSSTVYSTSEAQMSSETVVVVDFTLACKNNPETLNLYAEFNGRALPASQTEDKLKYQVSFTTDHKKLPSGKYNVRFFDDDLYAELRKAQRAGEDTSALKSLFDVNFNHQAASYGPWVQTEHIAAGVAILVFYLAYTARSQLQS